jgi:hypothetical protein
MFEKKNGIQNIRDAKDNHDDHVGRSNFQTWEFVGHSVGWSIFISNMIPQTNHATLLVMKIVAHAVIDFLGRIGMQSSKCTTWLVHGMLVLMVSLSVPISEARADSTKGVVYLKVGGSVRGELMELFPNSKVTMRLADGTKREYDWAEIDRVEDAEGTLLAGGSVRVKFHASNHDTNVEISEIDEQRQRKNGNLGLSYYNRNSWRTICIAPCEARFAPGIHRIRMDGKGVTTYQQSFNFQPGETNITVHPGSNTWFTVGVVTMGIGLASLVIGGLYWGIGSLIESGSNTTEKDQKSANILKTIGIPMTIGGAVASSVGIGLFVSNLSSMEKQENALPVTRTGSAPQGVQGIRVFGTFLR